jgi:putative SOS response-associated peptidase YedK
LIAKDDSPFAFAGIWDRWKDDATGEVLESFAIVTVDPSEWMAKYHDRMGVILSRRITSDGSKKEKSINCRSTY